MARNFVAINDWCHQLLREIGRETPLLLEDVHYLRNQLDPERLPEAYFSVVACHTLDGLPLEQVRTGCWRIRAGCKRAVWQAVGGFDATRLDRRCWHDLRLQPAEQVMAPPFVAGEVLSFGVGTLRRAGIWGTDGRIRTELEQVSARIWALRRQPASVDGEVTKQAFDSTNILYGDVLGQLEQLWARRADLAFLDQVAKSLEQFRGWRELPASINPPLNCSAVMAIHLRSQAKWRVPPATGRALLRRVEWLLENTILDNLATTVRSGKPSRISE